jgi:O-antigen/teichoic acid export membrane protein
MEEKAIHGIRWTVLGSAATRAISLGTTLVLAHLLVPDDFGLLAFGLLLVSVITYFGISGLPPTVVIARRLTRVQLETALSSIIWLQFGCAVLLVVIAPFAGKLVGGHDASAVIAALGATLVFRGVAAFYAALMQRKLLFARRIGAQAVETLTLGITALALAAAGAGVWSLVAGQVAGSIAAALSSILLAPYRVRPSMDLPTARSLWRTGRGFVLQGGVSFVEQNTDYFVVGSALGAAPLGFYSMAFRLSELPYSAIVDPLAQVTFAGFARMRRRDEDVAASFLTVLRLTALCALPIGLILSGASKPFVETVLGQRWLGMIGVLSVLGVWGSLRVVQATIGWFVNSVGFAWNVGTSYAVMLVVTVPLLVAGALTLGLEAVAWVMVLNIATMTLITARIASRLAGVPLRRQWAAVRPSVVAGAIAWVACRLLSTVTGNLPPGASLLLAVGGAVVAYALVVLSIAPGLLPEAWRQMMRMLRRLPTAVAGIPSAEQPHA